MMLIDIKALYDEVWKHIKPHVTENTLAGYEEGNFIGGYGPEGYLWDTPHGNWTGTPDVRSGHSDTFVKKIQTVIAGATKLVDITTMKVPDGKFWTAIKDGLLEIAKKQRHVHVRMLIGFPVGYWPPNLWHKLEEIAKELKGHAGYVSVDLGIYRYFTSQSYPEGWNHSKIIAVDGKVLITGGHNLWDEDYLGLSPIFDLSMQMNGPVAYGAHIFADHLWNFIHRFNRRPQSYSHRMRADLTVTNDAPRIFHDLAKPPAVGKLRSMWVTNTGRGVFMNNDKEIRISTMQFAFREALKSASHCRISQQSFGSLWVNWSGRQFELHRHDFLPEMVIYHKNATAGTWHAFNFDIMNSLADFLQANRNSEKFVLEILMSPPDKGAYSNGESEVAILDILAYLLSLRDTFRNLTRQQLVDLMNRLVKLCWPAITSNAGVPARYWSGSGKPMYTHAKFWMLDEKLFYVGSENMYPNLASSGAINAVGGLQEFGVIVEADETVRDLITGQYHALGMKYGYRRSLDVADLTF
ncbi:MAG: hypothetical protein JST22_12260 [Bacteroidetes bacterium]|nr:hypothetical protein [Bacteroidota bacterium]